MSILTKEIIDQNETPPAEIWAKAHLSYSFLDGTSGGGPLWVGVREGQAMATHRWDIPAGAVPLADLMEEERNSRLREFARFARLCKLPEDTLIHVRLSILMKDQAPDPKADGQFGLILDSQLATVLQGIPADDMSWITTPQRKALSDSFTRLPRQHIGTIAIAINHAGYPITIGSSTPARLQGALTIAQTLANDDQ